MDYAELSQQAAKHAEKIYQSNYIRIGGGTSGQAAGAYEVLRAVTDHVKQQKIDAQVALVGSLGLMYLEPTLDIADKSGRRILYGNVTPETATEIVTAHLVKNAPPTERAYATVTDEAHSAAVDGVPNLDTLDVWRLQNRVVMGNSGENSPLSILDYVYRDGFKALNKALIDMTPGDVLEEVKNSNLRGRGGAGFSAGIKWSFLASSKAPQPKYVLCNCEEGDPGAFNDKSIVENDPFKLIEGLILCGYATHASKGYVFIRAGHEIPIENMRRAIEQAYDYGILGKNIFGSGLDFDLEVSLTGDSYVAGEETAMMEAVEGKRAQPRFKPPFPAAAGLWQRPTNINNVKTLSYVAAIVLNGAEWFKSIGTDKSTGTALACLSGHIARPGLYEVDTKMSVRELLYEVGGGPANGRPIKMLQTGGPLGGIMGESGFDAALCFDQMGEAGAILGSGGIVVCDDTISVVDLVRNLVVFNQFESCGKCFPCRLGYTHMLEVMERICAGQARAEDRKLLVTIGDSMKQGSLCGHGQLGYNPIASAFRYFEAEFMTQLEPSAQPVGFLEDGSMLVPTRTRP